MNSRFHSNNKALSSRVKCKAVDSWGKWPKSKKSKPKEKQEVTKGIWCFKCNETRDRSSDCLRCKFANVTQSEHEVDFNEQEIAKEDGDFEVIEENNEEVVCI